MTSKFHLALALALFALNGLYGQESARLAYHPQADEVYTYDASLTVTVGNDKKQVSRDQLTYRVIRITEEQISFEFSGSLLRNSSPFPMHRTSRFSISPSGELLSLDGQMQLPGLLGEMPMIIFEQLDGADEKGWQASEKVTLESVERDDRRSLFGNFGPPLPVTFPLMVRLGSFDRPTGGQITIGKETLTYSPLGTEKNLRRFGTEYELKSAETVDGERTSARGSGTWVFNTNSGMPERQEFKRSVVLQQGNISVTMPIELKITRV